MLFSSGIWYGKIIFLKIIFKGNLSTSKMLYGCIYAVELRQHDHTLDGTQFVVFAGLGWSRHTCIPKGFMYYRDHFISTVVSSVESYTALSYVLP